MSFLRSHPFLDKEVLPYYCEVKLVASQSQMLGHLAWLLMWVLGDQTQFVVSARQIFKN